MFRLAVRADENGSKLRILATLRPLPIRRLAEVAHLVHRFAAHQAALLFRHTGILILTATSMAKYRDPLTLSSSKGERDPAEALVPGA